MFPGDRLSLRSIRRFLGQPERSPFWVAELDGRVVGNLLLLTRNTGKIGRIYSLAVAPQARRRGFGERMIAAAEAWAKEAGFVKISLEVRHENAAARQLYETLGFVERRALPGYYEDGAHGVRLEKRLDG